MIKGSEVSPKFPHFPDVSGPVFRGLACRPPKRLRGAGRQQGLDCDRLQFTCYEPSTCPAYPTCPTYRSYRLIPLGSLQGPCSGATARGTSARGLLQAGAVPILAQIFSPIGALLSGLGKALLCTIVIEELPRELGSRGRSTICCSVLHKSSMKRFAVDQICSAQSVISAALALAETGVDDTPMPERKPRSATSRIWLWFLECRALS